MTEGLDYVLHKLDELGLMIARLSTNAESNVTWASKNISDCSKRINDIWTTIGPVIDKLDKHLEYHPMPIQNSIDVLKDNQQNIYHQIDLLKERMDTLELKKKK